MDIDTIFPNLSYGEVVLGKYRHSECCNVVETICILTNFRLLIRWKETFCLCFHQSEYTSIALSSIARIDETRPNRYYFFVWTLIVFTSFMMIIMGSTIFGPIILWPGLILLAGAALILFWFYLILKKKFVAVYGPGGSIILKFDRSMAREFEAKLSELIYMARMQHTTGQTNIQGKPPPPTAPIFSVPSGRQYYSVENNYLPDARESNF